MVSDRQRLRGDLPLVLAALFAFLWAVARACLQSVTMDEADTYLAFVGRTAPYHWYPFPNNHILNSALMRMFTLVFGLSHLTLRLPALIGAAIYIGASLYVCVVLPARITLRFPLFLCLVYNPFVFDFLVAARGYSLAIGLLLCGGDSGGCAAARCFFDGCLLAVSLILFCCEFLVRLRRSCRLGHGLCVDWRS